MPGAAEIHFPTDDAHLVERGTYVLVDRILDPRERFDRFAREVGQRILAAQAHEVNAFPHVGTAPEVVAPGAVDAGERDHALGIDHGLLAHGRDERRAPLRLLLPHVRQIRTRENRLPPLDQPPVLLLDHGGVARQRPANLEVLSVDDALRARDFSRDHAALDRRVGQRRDVSGRNQAADPVAHEQVVLEADEESRLARITLPPGAAAQLQVNALAFVPVRPDDIETAEGRHTRMVGFGFAPQAGYQCPSPPCSSRS